MALLTTEELAELLKLEPTTLETWRSSDYGPPYIQLRGKRGAVRYDRDDVMRWLDGQKRLTVAEG